MYVLDQPTYLLDTMRAATQFFNDLRAGRPGAWDGFSSSEVETIKAQWAQVIENTESVDIVFPENGRQLSPTQLRALGRVMTAFIAAHDGRYSMLIDVMNKPPLAHPNPYALSFALAAAEDARDGIRRSALFARLNEEQVSAFRKVAFRIAQAFNSPGQAMVPDLSDVGFITQPVVEMASSRREDICLTM